MGNTRYVTITQADISTGRANMLAGMTAVGNCTFDVAALRAFKGEAPPDDIWNDSVNLYVGNTTWALSEPARHLVFANDSRQWDDVKPGRYKVTRRT